MPCDLTDDCPYPGKPGYDGELDAEHEELSSLYRLYKRLGAWALDQASSRMTPAQRAELVHVLYELDVDNARLKQAYPEVRLIWDASGQEG